jgi:hypothetical protein
MALLDVPPRYMWGWGPGVSGYCGSMTIQTTLLYFGSYASQDRVRGQTGGRSGAHEIVLGRSGCCSAIDIMPQLGLNVTQWPYRTEPQPQHLAFLRWMKAGVALGEPTAFGVYMKTEDNPGFDHIVPLVGFAGDPAHERLVFNDLHANQSMHAPIATFVASRAACRAALPWSERFAYCLPRDVNFGVRVRGNLDAQGALLPARLLMDEWSEPDYSAEDGKGERPSPHPLEAWAAVAAMAVRPDSSTWRVIARRRATQATRRGDRRHRAGAGRALRHPRVQQRLARAPRKFPEQCDRRHRVAPRLCRRCGRHRQASFFRVVRSPRER